MELSQETSGERKQRVSPIYDMPLSLSLINEGLLIVSLITLLYSPLFIA